MSTYSALRDGIKALHGFKGDDLSAGNFNEIDRKIRETYSSFGERAWQREVLKKCNVLRQVHICQLPYVSKHWKSLPPAELAKQKHFLRPSLVIDGLCFTGLSSSLNLINSIYKGMKYPPGSLAQHEDLCEQSLDEFVKAGGTSVKLLCSYVRTLEITQVKPSTARRLFAKKTKSMDPVELKHLQDYLIIRIAQMAKKRNLPLLVHTGYAIPPEHGDPENLLSLLRNPSLSDLKVALVHAGWPQYEKALLLSRTFRNCWFDMAWLPLLSPAVAKRILSEAVDILPNNKIMIGTDTGTAESFYGTVMLIRRLMSQTLQEKNLSGQFSTAEAVRYIRKIMWNNPCDFFNEPS